MATRRKQISEVSKHEPGTPSWTLGGHAPENGKGGMIDMASVGIPDEVPPHWDVAFAVADADAAVAKATELGASVTIPAIDTPVGRLAGIQDPAGATFTVVVLAQQPAR